MAKLIVSDRSLLWYGHARMATRALIDMFLDTFI
jgi:hypothetical protein